LDRLVQVLKSIADESRIRLLILCAQGEFTVSELVQVLGQSQPRVSRHLRILCDAGILKRTRQGSWVFYRSVKGGPESEFVPLLKSFITESEPVLKLDRKRLEHLKKERSRVAAQFFQKTASEWDNIRTHYVEDIQVESALQQCVSDVKPNSLLDIGTGTGRILKVLGPYVQDAEGIDFSHEMLNLARINLDHPSLEHCRVRHGDMYRLPYQEHSFNFITIHHVLHFANQPLEVLKEAGRVLKNKGQIAIVDFYSHEREEFRTKYHHHRLGFSDDEIKNWLDQIGLSMQPPIRIDGDPMEVVIWTGVVGNDYK